MSAVAEKLPDYTYWNNALAGTFGPVHDSDPQLGFFRKRTRRAGPFVPVAIWLDGEHVVALVDGKPADAAEIWTFVCQYPVKEAWYHLRMEGKPWPDEDAAVTGSLTQEAHGDNNAPADPAEILKGQIDAAIGGVSEYEEITSDESAAKAQSLRSRLLELSREADNKREELKRPHFEAGKAVDASFQPLVKLAKGAADAIAKALGAHETRKAKEAARLAAIAEEARIKAEREAVSEAAMGKVLPPPPPAPAHAPPPAAAPIRGAYGRAASVKIVKVATVVDQDAAYQWLKTRPEMVELIASLSQRAVASGFVVPGVTVTEERKVC